VAAHMGSWMLWDDVEQLADIPNVYIDTAFSLGSIVPKDNDSFYAENDNSLLNNEQFCHLVRKFGADRVLFGSDNPWDGQKEAVNKVKNSGLNTEELEKIFCKNACRLLEIKL